LTMTEWMRWWRPSWNDDCVGSITQRRKHQTSSAHQHNGIFSSRNTTPRQHKLLNFNQQQCRVTESFITATLITIFMNCSRVNQ
jgi:hypothetical protein